MTSASIDELIDRVESLERNRYMLVSKQASKQDSAITIDSSMRRARYSVEQNAMYSSVWKFVPEPYYTWSLDERAKCLGAPSIHFLCKSLLMENRKVPADDSGNDPTNPRFLLVVIQYAATLDVKKLANTIRALRPDVKSRLDESQFDFRIASEDDNRTITGFEHNSVTPFGILRSVPIIISSNLEPLKFFWMGGGHVHLKLGVAYTEFCRALNPVVADISRPRTAAELVDIETM